MYRNPSRVVPVVIVLIVIALVIAAAVSIGRAIFGGGDQTPVQEDVGQTALLNTSTNRSVRMTVRGPIVADENFRSYQVSVDPLNRSMVTYSGYLEQTINSKQYPNNLKAYEEFVYALDKANLMKGTAFEGDKDDTRGICASGRVYEFEVLNNNVTVKRLWTSTCKGSPGSFKASVEQVTSLFTKQIPDSRTLLREIDL